MIDHLRRALAGDGITPSQGLMVMALGTDTVLVSNIIHDGYYDGTNASYNLNVLEKNGLIMRSSVKGDRRKRLVSLTAEGLDLCIRLRRKLAVKQMEAA
jgi:DNA-binding MarR family transcriptional regulator